MGYQYSDESRENEPHALPDVEVFWHSFGDFPDAGFVQDEPQPSGWFYAFGFPGCLWDSEPVGPFETEAEALKAARDEAYEDHVDSIEVLEGE